MAHKQLLFEELWNVLTIIFFLFVFVQGFQGYPPPPNQQGGPYQPYSGVYPQPHQGGFGGHNGPPITNQPQSGDGKYIYFISFLKSFGAQVLSLSVIGKRIANLKKFRISFCD